MPTGLSLDIITGDIQARRGAVCLGDQILDKIPPVFAAV